MTHPTIVTPGTIAQENNQVIIVDETANATIFENVVFQSGFDSNPPFDESQYHTPVTLQGVSGSIGTLISSAYVKFGTAALRTNAVGLGAKVSSTIFDTLFDADFTVEFFIRFDPGTANGGVCFGSDSMQILIAESSMNIGWLGRPPNTFDSANIGVGPQYVFRDVLHNIVPGAFGHIAVCRKGGTLRMFVDGVLYAKTFGGQLYGGQTNEPGFNGGGPLWIGSDGRSNCGNCTMDGVRVSRCAWYADDNGFTPPSAAFLGPTKPPFVSDRDTIYDPVVLIADGGAAPSLFVDSDTIYAPSIDTSIRAIYPPMLFGDATVGPTFVNVNSTGISGIDGVYTNGGLYFGFASPLPVSRVNGNLLISIINVEPIVFGTIQPSQNLLAWHEDNTYEFRLGNGWQFGGQFTNPYYAQTIWNVLTTLNVTAWAWRIVDGTEIQCEWLWDDEQPSVGQAVTFQFKNANTFHPVGNTAFTVGQSNAISIPDLLTRFNNSLVLGGVMVGSENAFFASSLSGAALVNNGTTDTSSVYGGPNPGVTVGAPWTLMSSNHLGNEYYKSVPVAGPSGTLVGNQTNTAFRWTGMMMEINGTPIGDDQFSVPIVKRDPVLVNVGALSAVTSTTVSPALPASRVNGNLLIAWVQAAGAKTFSAAAGWIPGDTSSDASSSSAWFWRVVDGTEVSPAFTWTGSAVADAQVFQITNVDQNSPIGSKSSNVGSGTTLTAASITTVHDLAMVFGIFLTRNSQTIPLPTGFTSAAVTANANGSLRLGFEYKHPLGTTSDAVSVAITSTNWHGFQIEIKPPFGNFQMFANLVPNDDTFYSPVTDPQGVNPSLVSDSDSFGTPVVSWSPSNLSNLKGWWDASKASTVTDDGSGKCSQWNDQSSNANNMAQATSGSRPTITTSGINGLQTLTFASQFLEKLSITGMPNLTTGIGWAIVLKYSSVGNNGPWDISSNTNTNTTAQLINTGGNALARTSASGASKAFSDTASAHVFSGSHTTTIRDLWIDGTQGTAQNTTIASQNSTNMRFGELFQNTFPFAGQIAEIIFYSGNSSTDRQKVEGYLAWKWGTQGSLPAGHPYKSTPPI